MQKRIEELAEGLLLRNAELNTLFAEAEAEQRAHIMKRAASLLEGVAKSLFEVVASKLETDNDVRCRGGKVLTVTVEAVEIPEVMGNLRTATLMTSRQIVITTLQPLLGRLTLSKMTDKALVLTYTKK